MKKSSMLFTALLAGTSLAAIAAEPVQLSDAQMATVVAGGQPIGAGLGIQTADHFAQGIGGYQIWGVVAADPADPAYQGIMNPTPQPPGGYTDGGLLTAGRVVTSPYY